MIADFVQIAELQIWIHVVTQHSTQLRSGSRTCGGKVVYGEAPRSALDPDPGPLVERPNVTYLYETPSTYVAYNENSAVDDAWVINDLQPNLEEGPEPLKLCIKSRNFTPGHFLLDSIDESIHQSRKTILVLSPNFVDSEWCYHEMRMAQMRLFDDNLDVLVLVLLNEIPENKMTLSLRHILCQKDYLNWPKNRTGQNLFWQRLRQEIKRPVQVDRCFHI